jgi:hypothetical protein
MFRPIAAVVVAAMLITASPAAATPILTLPADALLPMCKSQVFSAQSVISAQDARQRWASQMSASFGRSWSRWNVATARSETVVTQLGGHLWTASARPCRPLHLLIAD